MYAHFLHYSNRIRPHDVSLMFTEYFKHLRTYRFFEFLMYFLCSTEGGHK